MKEFVRLEFVQNRAEITFFHPQSNSFPSSQLKTLVERINEVNSSKASVLVLKSIGKTFCSGASFDELLQIEDKVNGGQFFSGFANVINAMRKCRQPIITLVQGKAVGGGVGIIAASDYVLASNLADIKLSELTIGIGPFVIEPAITRKIGLAASSELALEAHAWKSCKWAFEKGLYNYVYENEDELNASTLSFVEKLSSYNPEALFQLKKIFWEGTEDWDAKLLERASISGNLVLSNFTKVKLKEFKSK